MPFPYRRAAAAAAGTLVLAAVTAAAPLPAHAGPPAEFDKTVVTADLEEPTAFRFLPGGGILIAEKQGAIRLYAHGELHDEPVLSLPTANADERGLLGLELDPDFATNKWFYVAYTHADNLNRLSRFTMTGEHTADPASEVILLRSNQQANVFHHGGELRFGPDGKLYWSLGINVYHPNAPNLGTLHGKVLRINKDGSIPADNPFVGRPGAEPAIWAYGLRNTFRFDVVPDGPNAGKLLGGDVGGAEQEELNLIERGADYGWPYAEGVCAGCGYAQPVYTYPHTAPPASAGSISAVEVYDGDAFPAEYDHVVFFGDYTLGFVKYLVMDPSYTSVIAVRDFDLDAGTPVQLTTGPDGALYQLNIYPGALYRIAPSGGNRTPVARGAATPDNGLAPLAVQFSSAGSADPDGTPLSYLWTFPDGTTSTTANPQKTFTANGVHNVTLRVSDGEKADTTTVPVQVGNRRPTGVITSPVAESGYDAGDVITYAGTATDPDSGTLPASAYSWSVIFHHAEHVHPFLGPISGVTGGTFIIPRIVDNIDTTWYEVQLTVTDSGGLKHTSSVHIRPHLVTLTFGASTPGLQYTVDGIPYTGTRTERAVVGVERTLGAVSPQWVGGLQYLYDGWSDGGAQTHVITTPAQDAAYTVDFQQINPPPAPWDSDDIGTRTIAGLSSYDDGAFTVQGGGHDIWDATDEFRYVHRPLVGDGTIVARLTGQTETYEWAKAGVMIKESATEGARYAALAVTPDHGVHFQADFAEDDGEFAYTLPNAWLKLTRTGATIDGFLSADGQAWTPIGTTQLALPATATIGLFVTSHDNTVLSTATFDHVTVSGDADPALPSPWVHQDVGAPAIAGGATEIGGVFNVTGAGGDIWGEADQFHFVHQPLTGNGTIIARVAGQQDTEEWAKAGLMIKDGTAAGATYALLGVTPEHGVHLQANFATDLAGSASAAPRWLKLTRIGTTVTGHESPDGNAWTLIGSVQLPALPATAQVGLFVTSHDAGQAGLAVFEHVSITAAAPSLPAGWSQADVGAPALLGSAGVTGSTWTVSGAGHDVWADTDQFHYVYRELPTDGTITARVLTQANTNDWAKSGVMIKQSTAALSPYAAVFLSPAHGIHFQHGFTADVDGGPGSVRTWLRLVRAGSLVTAYRSADGATWTPIGTTTITGPATAGLFVTSHNGSALNTTTFDQVALS